MNHQEQKKKLKLYNKEGFFEKSKLGRIIGAFVAGLFNFVCLMTINRYVHYLYIGDPEVKYPLLTSQFNGILPFVYFSLILQIIGQFLNSFINKYFIRQIVTMILDGVSLFVTVTLILVFPFNFNDLEGTPISFLNSTIMYAILGATILGTLVGIIVNFVKTISYSAKRNNG